jgi:zona occludens toxin
MAIKLYTGIQGSGKTYEVVTVVILGALREGRRIVSNIAGLNYEAMRALLVAEGSALDTIGSIFQVGHDDVLKPNFWRTDRDRDEPTIIQPGDVLILDEII